MRVVIPILCSLLLLAGFGAWAKHRKNVKAQANMEGLLLIDQLEAEHQTLQTELKRLRENPAYQMATDPDSELHKRERDLEAESTAITNRIMAIRDEIERRVKQWP